MTAKPVRETKYEEFLEGDEEGVFDEYFYVYCPECDNEIPVGVYDRCVGGEEHMCPACKYEWTIAYKPYEYPS